MRTLPLSVSKESGGKALGNPGGFVVYAVEYARTVKQSHQGLDIGCKV
jgi:hypothetical protein